jgi:tRNA(Ile)-lysidine synthase
VSDLPASLLRVAVAVSGGPDSLCLLHVLRELAPQLGISLSVTHLNHKLRGQASDQDQAFVTQVARELRLPLFLAEVDIARQIEQNGGNLEQTARRARRAFFSQLIAEGKADRVALGHTRDDQAETVLFRILRGSGWTGLAGILPVTREGLIRPLLDCSRAEVEQFLRDRGLPWREDASNLDTRFARNRLRHQLLPQLAAEWNPAIHQSLAQLADLASEEERLANARLRRYADLLRPMAGGIEVGVQDLRDLPMAISRRLLRKALSNLNSSNGTATRFQQADFQQAGFQHVDAILDLSRSDAGEGKVSLPGVTVTRSFGLIHLGFTRPAGSDCPLRPDPQPIRIPGTYPVPGGGGEIRFERQDLPGLMLSGRLSGQGSGSGSGSTAGRRGSPRNPCDTLEAVQLGSAVDWARIEQEQQRLGSGLQLRTWQAGDHYRPVGQSRDRKLRELFQKARIPSWRRPLWPIVTIGDTIIWAKQFGVAQEYAAGVTGAVLWILDEDRSG